MEEHTRNARNNGNTVTFEKKTNINKTKINKVNIHPGFLHCHFRATATNVNSLIAIKISLGEAFTNLHIGSAN